MGTTRLNERDLTRIVRRMINEAVIVPLSKEVLATMQPGTGSCTVKTVEGGTPQIYLRINGRDYYISSEHLSE